MQTLFIGGPWDGRRLHLSKRIIDYGAIDVPDPHNDIFRYDIHKLVDTDKQVYFVAISKGKGQIILALIDGYRELAQEKRHGMDAD